MATDRVENFENKLSIGKLCGMLDLGELKESEITAFFVIYCYR
jgi:hypothetical protein